MDEKRRRRYLLNKGNKKEHSHLIVVIDRSNYMSEELTRYVKRNEDIKNILFQYVCNPNLEILNIYNYDMDFETDYYCSLFEEDFFHPKEETDLQNSNRQWKKT